MILVPSNLIIQKEKIPGYNNVLTLATDKMKFGKNTSVNYKAPIIIPKTTDPASSTPKTKTQVIPKTTQGSEASIVTPKTTQTNANVSVSKPKASIASVASEILGVTMMVGGFLFSKYIF